MKLKDWADKTGVKYLTAYRWFKAGTLPVPAYQTDSGTIIVEDPELEQSMMPTDRNNDAMSLFLKKTVEFSKDGSSVEDFAAYVISNFSLKLASISEGPKYSRQKPKSEDIQKHFKQFIPKTEKPKVNSFVMDKEAFEEISPSTLPIPSGDVNSELVQEFSQAVENPIISTTTTPTYVAPTPSGFVGAMSTEGTITQSVDLHTTPQSINYTGSNNRTFGSSLTYVPITGVDTFIDHLYYHPIGASTAVVSNSIMFNDIGMQGNSCVTPAVDSLFNNNSNSTYDSLEEITDESDNKPITTNNTAKLNQPRSKRGRKPSKR